MTTGALVTDTAGPALVPITVHKVVTVKATPEKAFRRFTDEMASWWPLQTHSVGGRQAESVVMEGRVGGRIVERINDGRECHWGTVLAWEPPRRVAFTWHPGREASDGMTVEVRFAAEGERTRVELEHRGFESLGPRGRRALRGYRIGWEYVLGRFAERTGAAWMAIRLLNGFFIGLARVLPESWLE